MNDVCAVLAAFSAGIGAALAFRDKSYALALGCLGISILALGFFIGKGGL
jgi:hypothetical protein